LSGRVRLRPAPVLAAVTAVVVSLLGQAPAQGAAEKGAAEKGAPESRPAAARALAGARAALAGETHRDVTLSLRELRQHRDELSADDRASADRLLTRPATSTSKCFTTVCVHWSTTGAGKATSAYAAQVAAVAEHVLETYDAAGYRAPEADGSRGGNGLLDIYLQDLGGRGLYGYCDSDEPRTAGGPRDAWAYCAFDNDYREFPTHTPQQNLEVTAAHELFHAVQFAYDYDEDGWFMEATATWAEDELYDDVDDNIQYLSESPLAQPAKSMDHFQRFGVRQYGDWIFFRYLTETFDARSGGLPTLVRELWERAVGDYSISAVAHVLAEHHTDLRTVWAAFADANRRPGTSYAEGAANHYPSAAPAGRSGSRPSGPTAAGRPPGSTTWRARRTASSALPTAPHATCGCGWTCPQPGVGPGWSSPCTGPRGARRPPRSSSRTAATPPDASPSGATCGSSR